MRWVGEVILLYDDIQKNKRIKQGEGYTRTTLNVENKLELTSHLSSISIYVISIVPLLFMLDNIIFLSAYEILFSVRVSAVKRGFSVSGYITLPLH